MFNQILNLTTEVLQYILNFLPGLSGMDFGGLFFFIAFVVIIYTVYRVLKLAFKALLVAIAAALFPFIGRFFGYPIPISLESILYYASSGVLIFIIIFLLEKAFWIVKLVTLPIRKLFGKSEKEEIEEEVKKDLEKEEE